MSCDVYYSSLCTKILCTSPYVSSAINHQHQNQEQHILPSWWWMGTNSYWLRCQCRRNWWRNRSISKIKVGVKYTACWLSSGEAMSRATLQAKFNSKKISGGDISILRDKAGVMSTGCIIRPFFVKQGKCSIICDAMHAVATTSKAGTVCSRTSPFETRASSSPVEVCIRVNCSAYC